MKKSTMGLLGLFVAGSIGASAEYLNYNAMNNPSINDINFNQPNIFILHRNGCKYCESAKPLMKDEMNSYNSKENLKDGKKVYMVEVDTELGRYLVKNFNIEKPYTTLLTTGKNSKSKFLKEYEVKYIGHKPTLVPNSDGVKNLIRTYDNMSENRG